MYQLIRRMHLFTGLVLLVFVLMYFISGYVLIHEHWFGGREPKVTKRVESLDVPLRASDALLASQVQDRFHLSGQSSTPEHRKDGWVRISYVRPGRTFQVAINPEGKQVTITRNDFGFAGVANGMHRLRGYHGGWVYWLWAAMYDLASAGLIVFAITGIVLWYQSTSRRLAGWLCLAAGFGFTAAMIAYLMLSR